jgi:SAM-dependent methyltransferase
VSNNFTPKPRLILQKPLTCATFRQTPDHNRCLIFKPTLLYLQSMTDFTNLTYADLDWDILRNNAQLRKGRANKGAKEWDKKSASFASRNTASPYVSLVLSHLPLDPAMTVLDVGSGPGTLALPIAGKVSSVCAIDFSPNMLHILDKTAVAQNINNIETIECAWEDDWDRKGVGSYDLTIASRSMSVENLSQAIHKLNTHARRYVFIVDRISPTPFDPAAFAAVGRPFNSGPDYIYTVNVLYTMGIHPHISVLKLDQENHYRDLDEAMHSYTWMLKDLTAAEEAQLHTYLTNAALPSVNGGISIRRSSPPKWALIWWEKEQTEI